MIDDWELLQRWVMRRDEVAFGELVSRHVGMVYGAAVRMVGSEGAEDVVQAVFLLLVQQAGRIQRRDGPLAGWLYRVVGYCSRNVRKQEGRRKRREREVAMMRNERESPGIAIPGLDGLDEALARLSEKERVAIVVRYLEGKTVAETGRVLGISTEAVEKRLERGVAKLRKIFAKSSASVVAGLCAEGAKEVPVGVTSGVMAVGVGEVSAVVVGIAKGAAMAMKMAMLVKVVSGVAAVLVLVACVVVAQEIGKPPPSPITVGKETTVITEPLHADGMPDYVAAMNARFSKGVTPENNAFVAWLEVMGTDRLPPEKREQILKMSGAKDGPRLIEYYTEMLKRCGIEGKAAEAVWYDSHEVKKQLWEAKDFPLVAEWLKENEAALDKIRDAFSRDKYWHPYVGESLMDAMFPSASGEMKHTADMLCGRATFRAKAGDFEGFLSDVIAVKRMARHVSQGTVIACLVGAAMDSMVSRSIAVVAGTGILSAEQYAELAKAIDALEPMPSTWEAIDIGERWGLLNLMISLATGKAKPFFEVLPDMLEEDPISEMLLIDRTWVDWDVMLRRANQHCDKLISLVKAADSSTLDREWDREINNEEATKQSAEADSIKRRQGETRAAYTQRIGDALFSEGAGGTAKAENLYRMGLMEHEMMKVVVAAGRYRAEKGNGGGWPEKLDVLVPGYLKELPTDIYSGKAVLHAQSEKGIRVYSVGLNRYDDGGIRARLKDGRFADDIVVGVEVDPANQ